METEKGICATYGDDFFVCVAFFPDERSTVEGFVPVSGRDSCFQRLQIILVGPGCEVLLLF